jgi:signal transduction histidine kinase
MREVVNRNFGLLTSQAAQKQISLSSKIEDIVVSVDAHMVDAIVRNLLTNAIKFTHPGGRVSVSVTQDENDVRVSVSDTGLGIGEEHISKLFQIGSHYKRFGTAQEKGTGMGLILCKEFVAQHGGKIWVESEVDHGSTFIFTLPRQPTDDEAQ